jgi:hypothetical protein
VKAFISYSLDSSEKYILSLISMRLSKEGINIVSNYSNEVTGLSLPANQIRACQFFIGIIARKGTKKNKVIDEWKIARASKIPALLLIEDRIKINNNGKEVVNPNIIKFNRAKLNEAVETVNSKTIGAYKADLNKTNSDAAAWVLGGSVVLLLLGIIASGTTKTVK